MDSSNILADSRPEAGTVVQLLADIAEARARLDQALENHQRQRQVLVANCARLRATLATVEESQKGFYSTVNTHRKLVTDTLNGLTPRETEVLRLVAEGFSTKEIAGRLHIAFKTVVTHRTHLLKKLDCHETASLVRHAIRSGLVT